MFGTRGLKITDPASCASHGPVLSHNHAKSKIAWLLYDPCSMHAAVAETAHCQFNAVMYPRATDTNVDMTSFICFSCSGSFQRCNLLHLFCGIGAGGIFSTNIEA